MKMTMSKRDVMAVENGMRKYNVDVEGLLEIVESWLEERKQDKGSPQYDFLIHFRDCVKTYIQWMN